MWPDNYESGLNGLWGSSKTLKERSDEMKEMSGAMGMSAARQTDQEMMEEIQKMMANLGEARDPYEVATKEMDKRLEEKGLPCMEKILEALEESHPEFFL